MDFGLPTPAKESRFLQLKQHFLKHLITLQFLKAWPQNPWCLASLPLPESQGSCKSSNISWNIWLLYCFLKHGLRMHSFWPPCQRVKVLVTQETFNGTFGYCTASWSMASECIVFGLPALARESRFSQLKQNFLKHLITVLFLEAWPQNPWFLFFPALAKESRFLQLKQYFLKHLITVLFLEAWPQNTWFLVSLPLPKSQGSCNSSNISWNIWL